MGSSLEWEHDSGCPLQVPRVQPHGADSGCAAEKSSVESGDLRGGNSGGLVEGLAGGPLVPHDEKAEVQGGGVGALARRCVGALGVVSVFMVPGVGGGTVLFCP